MTRTSTVRTPEQSAALRRRGERRARVTLIRLIACASIWRTALTRIVPLAGCSAWWATLLCLLPGLAAFIALALLMRATRTSTLLELLRRCLGRGGAAILNVLLAAGLLCDGLSSMTALTTFFTQGIGTRGTQWTLALLTGGVLACCLHREGLARGAYLLRPVLLTAGALLIACALPGLRVDGLFPLLGDGMASVKTALEAGWGLAWPILLLLTVPEEKGRARLREAYPVVTQTVLTLLLLSMMLPHERLMEAATLAERLLLPARYASNALRMLWQCLLLLTLFLAIAGSVRLSTGFLASSLRKEARWLPWAVLALLTLSQTIPPVTLERLLSSAEPWLLLPFVILTVLCIPTAIRWRNRP